MPRTLSAERAARAAEIKKLQNRAIKSATKTAYKKAEEVIQAKDLEKAKLAVKEAVSELDKAVKKKVIHANTAARRKSKLMKKFNETFGAQPLPPKDNTTGKKAQKAKKNK